MTLVRNNGRRLLQTQHRCSSLVADCLYEILGLRHLAWSCRAMLGRLEKTHGLVRLRNQPADQLTQHNDQGWDLGSCVWWFGTCIDRRGGPGQMRVCQCPFKPLIFRLSRWH